MNNYDAVDVVSLVRHCREQRARSAVMRLATRRASAHGAAMRVWARRMKAKAGAHRPMPSDEVLPRS